jgi:hypothetical protein
MSLEPARAASDWGPRITRVGVPEISRRAADFVTLFPLTSSRQAAAARHRKAFCAYVERRPDRSRRQDYASPRLLTCHFHLLRDAAPP